MSKLSTKTKLKEAVDRMLVAYRKSKEDGKDEVKVKLVDLDILFCVAAMKINSVPD